MLLFVVVVFWLLYFLWFVLLLLLLLLHVAILSLWFSFLFVPRGQKFLSNCQVVTSTQLLPYDGDGDDNDDDNDDCDGDNNDDDKEDDDDDDDDGYWANVPLKLSSGHFYPAVTLLPYIPSSYFPKNFL